MRTRDRHRALRAADRYQGEPTLALSLHRLSRWPSGDAHEVDVKIGQINRQFALSKGAYGRQRR